MSEKKKVTTLYLIRHGELNNPKLVFYDRVIPLVLSKTGKGQIENLGKFFLKNSIFPQAIYSSPLLRTKQSARILSKILGNKKIIFDKKLLERDSRNIAGRPLAIHKKPVDQYNNPLPDYWVESPESQARRISGFVRRILKKNKNKIVFIISHGDPLAFGMYRLLHPKKALPSILRLTGGKYLKKSQAWKAVFDLHGKIFEQRLIKNSIISK